VKRVRRYFAIAKEIAGIERRFRIHDVRHTMASKLAARGTPPIHIYTELGHASIATTTRYARIDAAALEWVRTKLNE